MFSLVRGPWEIRLARVDEPAAGVDLTTLRLRMGGWPVTAGRTSRLVSLLGDGTPGTSEHPEGSPLGGAVRVPWLDHPARPGRWVAALLELGATGGDGRVAITGTGAVRVGWPDGVSSEHLIDIKEQE